MVMFGSFSDSPAPEAKAAPVETTEVKNTGETVQESVPEENVEASTEVETTSQDEASEETSDDTDTEVDTEEDNSKKPKKGFARRIEKFNQKLTEKEREIEYWKKVALEQQGGKQQAAQPVVRAEAPKFDDYATIEDYTNALTDWKVEQAMARMQQNSVVQKVAETYDQRLAEFKKSAQDFDQVMGEFVEEYGTLEVPEIVQIAYESDVGPQLAYYLAKNPTEVERIAKLPSHRRLIELGKLEDKVATPKAKPVVEQKKVSKAAAPVAPVKGTGKVESLDLNDPNLSYTEWVRRREASLKKN